MRYLEQVREGSRSCLTWKLFCLGLYLHLVNPLVGVALPHPSTPYYCHTAANAPQNSLFISGVPEVVCACATCLGGSQ